MNKFWKIQIWDSSVLIFESKVKFGHITENSMHYILKSLISKHSLNELEIINSHKKRNIKSYSCLLDVQKSYGNRFSLSCGSNPYAIATITYEVNKLVD